MDLASGAGALEAHPARAVAHDELGRLRRNGDGDLVREATRIRRQDVRDGHLAGELVGGHLDRWGLGVRVVVDARFRPGAGLDGGLGPRGAGEQCQRHEDHDGRECPSHDSTSLVL